MTGKVEIAYLSDSVELLISKIGWLMTEICASKPSVNKKWSKLYFKLFQITKGVLIKEYGNKVCDLCRTALDYMDKS